MSDVIQEIIDELERLFRLEAEGKKVGHLIEALIKALYESCEESVDTAKTDEKNQKNR